MRYPLKNFSHNVKLMLAQLRHSAKRAIAPDQGLTGTAFQFGQLEERLMMSASPAAMVAAPVNVVPDGQTLLQDRILSFNDANGNGISISDSDVGANDLQVTLQASAGSFAITDVGTAEYVSGDGFEDATLVLQGTEAELNAALQTLHFTASEGFVGVVDITVTTDDLGNGGTITSAQDSDIISVYVHDEVVTGEFVVANSATDELNRNANRGVARSLAVAPNGNLIAVWRTATDDVFFAIHASDNSVIATGQVNDPGITAGDITVATGGDGDFVVAWSQEGAVDADVYAQRYSATGAVVGSRIVVDTSVGVQQAITIDRNAAGDFVIAWENTSDGIHVRRFAADGTAIDATALSPIGSVGGSNASVGIDRDLNILVGWDDPSGQYVQRFDGSVWGTRHTLSTQAFAGGSSLGITENGEAVIAWHEYAGDWEIRYQQIGSDGELIGTTRAAASVSTGDEQNPSVGIDEAGNFVIAWEQNGDIQARQFDSAGDPLAGDLTLVAGASFNNNAAIAVLDVNNFAVLNTRQTTNADVFLNRHSTAAVSASDPVVDLRNRVVATANSTVTHTVLIGDDDTAGGSLSIDVTSSVPSLISEGNVSITGTGLYRTLQITPTADMTGSTDITVTVTDAAGNSTVQTIEVFVASPTITVTNASDEINGNVSSIIDLLANPGGDGISLREAITAANNTANNGGPDVIEFNIPGASKQTISLTSELPAITEQLYIDGQSQQGYGSSPLVALDGSLVVGNGLTIEADGVVIRGLSIFGFRYSGIDLDTGNGILIRNSDEAIIYDNYIGVDQTGQTGVGNDRDGIRIIGQSDDNVIGGVDIQRRNVISGNNANGITILGDAAAASASNEISFNYIGVGADGISDVGNSFVGVDLSNAFRTEILNNVISGNHDSGIELTGGNTGENKIFGNFIGVAADGVTAVGNDADGIALETSAGFGPGGTQIGGANSGEGNIIANNSLNGVRLDSGGGIGNSIRGNQIFNNEGGLGIDLLGVNGNDAGDTDSGTNNQQNFPLLTAADLNGGDLTIQGTLNSTPSTVFDIDIFSSGTADVAAAGQAETFLGTFSITTDGLGDSTFSHVFTGALPVAGEFVTATATNSSGSTSEFSANQVIIGPVVANTAATVSLSNVLTSVDENSDTSGGLKIADIVVTDDGQGTNTLSLSGADAADFEIVGTELRLRSGVVLDYEVQTSLSVEVRVDDASLPGSPEDSTAIVLSVNNLNDTVVQNNNVPVITPGQSFDIAETASAGTLVGVIAGTDADAGDVLSQWMIVSGNDDGQFVLDAATGELRLAANQTLNFDVTDTYVLSITATDGTNTSPVETVTVQVLDVDRSPTISAISDQVIAEDAPATTVSFNVFDLDTVTADLIVTAVSSDNSLIETSSLVISGTGANRELSFVSVSDASGGSTTITVTVSDGITSVNETFDVLVTAVNDVPVINQIADQTVDEDGTLAVSFSTLDIDAEFSSLTVSAFSSDLSLVSGAGIQVVESSVAPILSLTPESDQFGAVQITVTAFDGMETSFTTFLLIVNPVNDAPTLTNSSLDLSVPEQSLSISEGLLFTGAADIDSSDLQLVLNAGPLNGSLVQNSTGEYIYTPNVGFFGADQFVYSVSDGDLQSDLRVVNLDVPVAVPSPTVPNSTVPNSVSRFATPDSDLETTEVSSEDKSESESTSETSDDEPTGLIAGGAADEGSKTATERAEADQSQESGETTFGQIFNNSGDGFVYRKFVTVDEAAGRVVGSVILRDGFSQSQQDVPARATSFGSATQAAQFDQSDWQYYSDLTSTVGGVQEFRDNLQNEFNFSDLTTGTITLASTGAAVGFVVTAVRSGMLALGFLSQLPVWTLFDPLMVVDGVTGEDIDEDSIHDIVDRQSELNHQSESPSSLS